MQKIALILIGCWLGLAAGAQRLNVYPSNWWVGMKHSTIQVMIRGGNAGEAQRVSVDYPGVTVVDWHRLSNPHYLFVHLRIDRLAKQPGLYGSRSWAPLERAWREKAPRQRVSPREIPKSPSFPAGGTANWHRNCLRAGRDRFQRLHLLPDAGPVQQRRPGQ
jgi:hypothetical protein